MRSFAARNVIALLVVCLTAAACSRTAHLTVPTTTVPATAVCVPDVRVVAAQEVPRDVSVWASGKPVVGGGALWTVRSAINVPATHQKLGWILKFPWFTRPFGLPKATARRTDGTGTFRFDASEAQDRNGTWVASNLIFSTSGCWKVTGRYKTSNLHFEIQVGKK